MSVLPSFLERQLLFRFHAAPAPMLDYLGAQSLRAVLAALRLGALQRLESAPSDASTLAQDLGLDERGLRHLLRALAAAGYLTERRGTFRLSRSCARWLPLLVEGGEFFSRNVFENWHDLEASVRNGMSVPDDYAETLDAGRARELLVGLRAFSRANCDALISALPVPQGSARALDLGGGHGLHAARLCRKHLDLEATIFDQAPALDVARETVEAEGVAERVRMVAGDFMRDDVGEEYDLILLFNVLHGYDAARNLHLLNRTRQALSKRGAIAIVDQFADGYLGGPVARLAARMNGLNLFHARGGQAFPCSEVVGWMKLAGLRLERRRNLLQSPGSGLLIARHQLP